LETYDWLAEGHAIEGEGGQTHDDTDHPMPVSTPLTVNNEAVRSLPEGSVANIASMLDLGATTWNDGRQRCHGGGGMALKGLQHLWLNDHVDGIR
jgi:hypothetical protein